MNASPELYYEIEYRQHERALENAAAYRRAAELSPAQVVPYVSVFSRALTKVRAVLTRWRRNREERSSIAEPKTGANRSADREERTIPAGRIAADQRYSPAERSGPVAPGALRSAGARAEPGRHTVSSDTWAGENVPEARRDAMSVNRM